MFTAVNTADQVGTFGASSCFNLQSRLYFLPDGLEELLRHFQEDFGVE